MTKSQMQVPKIRLFGSKFVHTQVLVSFVVLHLMTAASVEAQDAAPAETSNKAPIEGHASVAAQKDSEAATTSAGVPTTAVTNSAESTSTSGSVSKDAEQTDEAKAKDNGGEGSENERIHRFMPGHPRLRRITKAAAFGIATGGILGPMLGAGVIGGAAFGAAEHASVRAIKDEHDEKKKGTLDHHWW